MPGWNDLVVNVSLICELNEIDVPSTSYVAKLIKMNLQLGGTSELISFVV